MSPPCWDDKSNAEPAAETDTPTPPPGWETRWSEARSFNRGWGDPHRDFDHPRWRAMRRVHSTQRVYARRFLGLIFVLLLITGGWVAGLAYVFTRLFGGGGPSTWLVWGGGMGLVLALPIVALTLAARVFRGYALPLAELIDAAEAVAGGDFEARVTTRGSRDFQRLARAFNHMVEELARSDLQRRNLTADVAHELRTPLHIIRGNLEGILDGIYGPTPEHIEATLDETRALARLVDDLRTLSLAEAGELPLRYEPVAVDDLLADVVTSFSAQAEAAGIDLAVDASSAAPPTIQADAGRLDQVLTNLVGNALRHTPRGGHISLGAGQTDGRVHLRVADTGEGIPPEDVPFIFDRFWRGDRARTHSGSTGGASSGLGLAIAAQLVRAHGGTIEVQSKLGRGTVFVVDLPVVSGDQSSG